MANTPTDTPLPDIEAAIKEEVAGINRTRRPPARFSTEPEPPHMRPLPTTEPPPAADPTLEATLPEILDLMLQRISALDDHIAARLARIERVLGIKG